MSTNFDPRSQQPKGARLAFGIIMILVYFTVGFLFFFDFFQIDSPAVNYVVGGLLCLYGIWRAYRLYKGLN
ncbi:MAG: hypothetical protein HDT02_05900 [Bacteroidales bacterium]|nr:hypothetical protein [Bacteroidales bacterium]MDE6230356.1 hypothetical protein [Muribaculaceae bacterium]